MLLLRSQLSLDAFIRSLSPAAWFMRGVGQTVTGSGVSQWDDVSGNARHLLQGTDAARPALQADGSVLFNGTSHFLKCDAFTLNQPAWVTLVMRQVTWTSGDVLFDGDGVAGGACQQTTSTPRISISAGSSAAEIATVTLNVKAVVAAVFNGGSSRLVRNLDVASSGNAGTNNMGGFTLGAIGGGAAAWSNIEVHEVVIIPIAPSTAQRERVVRGLMARHGVA